MRSLQSASNPVRAANIHEIEIVTGARRFPGGLKGLQTFRLTGPHIRVDITHVLASPIRTGLLLAARGGLDHNDADALRRDPAYRLATSSPAGLTPLDGRGCVAADAVTRHCASGCCGPARGR